VKIMSTNFIVCSHKMLIMATSVSTIIVNEWNLWTLWCSCVHKSMLL